MKYRFGDILRGNIKKVTGEGSPFPGVVVDPESHFKVPIVQLPVLAEEYVQWLETSQSADTCKCEWAVHPDDELIGKDECRICALSKTDSVHAPLPAVVTSADGFTHLYRPRRLRLKEENPLCPVHSKVGRITGFFEWLYLVHPDRYSSDSKRG